MSKKESAQYTYTELLSLIKFHRPDPTQIVVPDPIVRRSKKHTIIINFLKICDAIERNPCHVILFMDKELYTKSKLDSLGRLVIQGRFLFTIIMQSIIKYREIFVICISCKSAKTNLEIHKKNKLPILSCLDCLSVRTSSNHSSTTIESMKF